MNPTIKLEPIIKQRLDNIKERVKAKQGDITYSELVRRLLLAVYNDDKRKKLQQMIAIEDLIFIEDTHIYGIGLFDKDGVIP